MSPMTLTMPLPARRALWRLAMPFAKPGPRCSRVIGGRFVMRLKPSAAPVTTPSNRPSTGRMAGSPSSAVTSGISVVPGLAKQISMPAARAVASRVSAPFMRLLRGSSTFASPTRFSRTDRGGRRVRDRGGEHVLQFRPGARQLDAGRQPRRVRCGRTPEPPGEEVARRHRDEVVQDAEPVVDEMGDAEPPAHRLLVAAVAHEMEVRRGDAGGREEAGVLQPGAGPLADAWPGFADQEDPGSEGPGQRRESLDRAGNGWGLERPVAEEAG